MGLGHHHDATKWQKNTQCWKNRSSYGVYRKNYLTVTRLENCHFNDILSNYTNTMIFVFYLFIFFLVFRARILSSAVLVLAVIIVVRNWDGLILCLDSIWQYVFEAQPFR